jgi:peptidyl-prolyl cis-trans isomerase C
VITTAIAILAAATSVQVQALPSATEVVLTVNGEPLPAGELQLTAQSMAKQMAAEDIEPEPEQLFEAAVRQAIDHMLLAQEARRQGIEPTPKFIDTLLQHYIDEAGGREALERDLASRGSSLESLRAHLEESAAVNLLFERIIKPGTEVSDEDIKAYYDANQDNLSAPEQVHARHILFKVEAGASREAIETARRQAEEAHRRALAGEDFAELARDLSQDPSADNGGDLGFVTRKRLAPRFADAAFALSPGEISDVVLTGYGFHIIKVEERRAAGVPPLADIAERLHSRLTDEKAQQEIENLLETLRAEAEVVAVEDESAF